MRCAWASLLVGLSLTLLAGGGSVDVAMATALEVEEEATVAATDQQQQARIEGEGRITVEPPQQGRGLAAAHGAVDEDMFAAPQLRSLLGKKGLVSDYRPDGKAFPGAAAAAAAAGAAAGAAGWDDIYGSGHNPYAGIGAGLGVASVPGIGLAPSVTPGVTQGLNRKRDTIDARNRKARTHSSHGVCSDFRMTPPLSFPAGGVGPTDIEVGDLNGDHIKDLVVAASGSDVVVVFIGCGDGTYFPGVRYPVGPPGSFPYRIRLADINCDKRLDIVTANLGGGTLSILLGRGDGTFTNGFVFPTGGGGPVDIAIGDFNADGFLDIALALAKCETITVLWGDGAGGFVRPIKVSLGSLHDKGFPISIVAVDLNLDGFWDLVVGLSCTERKNLVVLTSLGDGTFKPPYYYDLGRLTRPVALAVGLFNVDLFPDIVVANGCLANTVSILLGKGDGTFKKPKSFSVEPGLAPQDVAVGDLNGDLHADIVTANALSNDITVLRGHGDGTFSRVRTFPVDGVGVPGPVAVAVGLLNHDVKQDVAAAHFAGNAISDLLNTCTLNLEHGHHHG